MKIPIGFVASAVLAGSLFAPGCGSQSAETRGSQGVPDAHPVAFFDLRTFSLAKARIERAAVIRPGVRGIIVPHHWLPADLIVEALRDLAGSHEVRTVILIGPNHIGAGGAAFTTSRLPWRTPFGTMPSARDEIDRLVDTGLVTVAPRVLTGEHSIAGLVPALVSYLPGAELVPIAVRAFPRPDELAGLVRSLSSILSDPWTVVIASVDFSHYRPLLEAKRRDIESIRALTSMRTSEILRFGNEHMDSPASIAILIESMRAVGAERFEVWRNATSADFGGGAHASQMTTYVTGAYLN